MLRDKRFVASGTLIAVAALTLPSASFSQVENVNMGTRLSVEGDQLVVSWTASGGSFGLFRYFTHFNIRFTRDGGPTYQFEHPGKPKFMHLGTFQRGVVYNVLVQACRRSSFEPSSCTSWEGDSCGTPRRPCDAPSPQQIRNGRGLCLDVHAPDQRNNGGRVQLWACNGSDQQLWSIRNGRITSFAGKCLDVHFPDLYADGGRVQIWDCNNSPQQGWVKDGSQVRSGGGRCLSGGSFIGLGRKSPPTQNGAPVSTKTCDGSIGQQWP